jgi:hypothetical protein
MIAGQVAGQNYGSGVGWKMYGRKETMTGGGR